MVKIQQLIINLQKKNGSSVDEAFQYVKELIVDVLTKYNGLESLNQNKLPAKFKGKILFLYHPGNFLNIFSKNHLAFFTAHLNLISSSDKELNLQKALMNYRATWPELKGQSHFLFAALLYDTFGRPPKEKQGQLPLLSTAVSGASIQTKPPQQGHSNKTRPDYEELQRNRKIIGDRGEKIVLELEKKRLVDSGKHELSDRVQHIAEFDDSKGFDILSFETDGTEKQIEVKATSLESFYNGFSLSANELEKSRTLDNYYLYLVSSAMSENPVIEIKRNPVFTDSNDYELIPNQYNVRLR